MISFIRIDDRMIHGQTVTRWALEYPCDGLIAVNDAAASNPVLKEAYKSASGKKTFVWTKEHFKEVSEKVLKSDTKYFLITKNPLDMKELLVDFGYNQSITQEEAQALEDLTNAGYTVEFALIKEKSIGEWPKFRGQFGF